MNGIVAELHTAWSAPLKIVLALALLWQVLGPAALAGVAVMLLAMPLNWAIARTIKACTADTQRAVTCIAAAAGPQHEAERQPHQGDQRGWAVQRAPWHHVARQVLNGIKVIKLNGWEGPFEAAIQKAMPLCTPRQC